MAASFEALLVTVYWHSETLQKLWMLPRKFKLIWGWCTTARTSTWCVQRPCQSYNLGRGYVYDVAYQTLYFVWHNLTKGMSRLLLLKWLRIWSRFQAQHFAEWEEGCKAARGPTAPRHFYSETSEAALGGRSKPRVLKHLSDLCWNMLLPHGLPIINLTLTS